MDNHSPATNAPSRKSAHSAGAMVERRGASHAPYRRTVRATQWLITALLFWVFIAPAYAAGSLTLILTNSPLTTVETGQSFTYRIDWECSATIGNCGAMTIDIPFDDTLFELVGISIVETGYTTNIATNPATITRPLLGDGDFAGATITLRARNTLTVGGSAAPVTVTGTITDPSGPPTTTVNVPAITVQNPTLQWEVRKQRVLPDPSLVAPAVWSPTQDAFVRYNVQYCSQTPLGNLPVNGAVLVDQIPTGAVVRNIGGGGYRADADGTPNPSGAFIFWQISPDTPLDPNDDLTGDVGCITRTVELEYPDTDFSIGDVVDNVVRGYRNGNPPDAGVCVADCIGTANRTDTLVAPAGTPNLSKQVSDPRPITHPGNAVFSWGLNTNGNNTPVTGLTLGDDIPTASDTFPLIDVYEIFAGTWPDDYSGNPIPATLNYYTVTSGVVPAGTLALASGSGGTRDIDLGEATPPRAIGDLVTRVELVFTGSVPMAFSFNSQPTLRFTPRPGMTMADYDDGTGSRQYSNCLGSTLNPTDACRDFRISNLPTTLAGWEKTASPSNVQNERVITFTARITVNQESSTSLDNPSYVDELPFVLEYHNFVATTVPPAPPTPPQLWTTFGPKFDVVLPAPLVGDTLNEPYVYVQPDTPIVGQTTITFFWTNNPADPRLSDPNTFDRLGNSPAPTFPINPLTVVPPATGERNVDVLFRARVKSVADGGYAGDYTNNVRVQSGAIDLLCPGATTATDNCDTDVSFGIVEVPATRATKWVRSGFEPLPSSLPPTANVNYLEDQYLASHTLNPNWTVCPDKSVTITSTNGTPPTVGTAPITFDPGDGATNGIYAQDRCVALGNPSEGFQYLLQIQNESNMPLTNFLLYDILPHIGDVGINQSQMATPRQSEFMVWLNPSAPTKIELLSPASWVNGVDYVIEYNNSTNPCRPEMTATTDPLNYTTAWHPGCDNTWTTTPGDWRLVRSFRVRQISTAQTLPGQNIEMRVNAYIPTDAELQAIGINRNATHPFNSVGDQQRALTGEIAWNLFAYNFRSATTSNYTLPAQPARVGIQVPRRLSVGNRVWIDDGGTSGNQANVNNRVLNATEAPVDGVTVQLYRWEGAGAPPNMDTAPTPGDPTSIAGVRLVATTTTANGGYYLFETDDTFAGPAYDWVGNAAVNSLRPGNYFVFIPPTAFDDAGDPLFGYVSSTGVHTTPANTDSRDRGVDNGVGATNTAPATNGVRSEWFTLRHNNTPTGEADIYNGAGFPYGPYGRGTLFQADSYSDLIRDFGFVQLMSIGNRVWYDTGTASGTGHDPVNGANNGVFDAIERGAAGVTVRLYRVQQDGTGNPTYSGTTPNIQTGYFTGGTFDNTYNTVSIGGGGDYLETTTDADGYYQFENLFPGNYYVYIPPSNFTFGATSAGDAVLAKYANSTGNTASDGISNPSVAGTGGTFGDGDDNRDKGIEDNFLQTNGIMTPVVHLRPRLGQTTTETDLGTRADGVGVVAENSNLTVDIGFYQPPMSLGNRVWRDYNNNGIQDPGEPGIEDVILDLFADENADNVPDGPAVATATTDADGYYRFDGLIPGRYVVQVRPSNFAVGNALEFFVNSVPTISTENVDMNDNGVNPINTTLYPTDGVFAQTVRLIPVSEPSHVASATHTGTPEQEHDASDPAAAPNPPRGQGPEGDLNSDLTVDFGFYRPSSIGNRVWIDDGAGTATNPDGSNAGVNTGVQEGTEGNFGVNGVTVELYRFIGGGDPLTTPFNPADVANFAIVDTRTTANNGYYLFDNLPEQDAHYYVFLPPSNFTVGNPLFQHSKSQPNFNNADDLNNNGAYFNFPVENGVVSNRIFVSPISNPGGWSPTGETELSPNTSSDLSDPTATGPNSHGRYRETDGFSDLTIDFSFIPERMSLGNRVWRDYNNNAVWNAGEPGIENVVMTLYLDADANGLPDGPAIATTTTDANGYYIFDNLLPGNYLVAVDASNFTGAGELVNLANSNNMLAGYNGADDGVDLDDNGIDTFDPVLGYISTTINLTRRAETTADTERSGNPAHGNPGAPEEDFIGRQQQRDDNSDLTIDFGFYRPSSIGNRVWLDDGAGTPNNPDGSNPSVNTGLQEATEGNFGVNGVTVELYRFIGGGDPLTTPFNPADVANFAIVDTRTTANNGYYLFDNLPEQDAHYYVFLPPSNFTVGNPLFQHSKSQPNFNNADDLNNNGAYFNFPVENGVVSNRIFVSPISNPGGWSPTGETELSPNTSSDLSDPTATGPNSHGRYRETDGFSDLTIDFSFIPERMSLGNRVWRDYNNNAVWNAGEPGIENVVMTLYLDADANGLPDGPAIATTTTDANGYYIFDNLLPGNYLVAVDASNFTGAGELVNLANSNNMLAGYNGADDGVDLDDNGIDTFDPVLGYISTTINLTRRAETTADTERSGNPAHGNPGAPEEDFIGRQQQRDDNSDLTIDFGFYRPSSIGNRVWLDNGAGGGVYNDGIQNGAELTQGINSVFVELWRYDGVGVPPVFDATTPFNATDMTLVRTVQTTDNGHYLFDGLPEENETYYVRVRPDNFTGAGALVPYDNSYPTFNDDTDRNDNGVYTNYPALHGIVSKPITVTVRDGLGNPVVTGWSPIGETELSPNTTLTGADSRGLYRETDDFSDLTIDFSFLEPRFSIGNRVWFDLNNNGVWDPAATSATGADEAGVSGVTVRLYRDTNGNGIFNRTSGDTLVATTTTDADGYYLFDDLPAGDYFVWIDELMFRAGAPLLNYYSSQPTEQTDADGDRNDNGIYDPLPLPTVKPTPEVGGVVSPMITLSKNSEPINEVDLSGNPIHDDGDLTYRGQRRLDSNSNLTVDFGFYKPMSIGNRVWFDVDGDGIRDAGEPGIDGVTLQLWRETTGDDIPDSQYQRNTTPGMVGIPPATAPYVVTTNANGYYLFDNLPPGRYVVVIPGGQPALAGLTSTIDDIDPAAPPATVSGVGIIRTDNNDNGIGTTDNTVAIRSAVITLTLDSEPTITSTPPETDIDPVLGAGRNGEEDRNSNLTIDFGFVGQLMALGNRVWFDPNNNGVQDGTENGIANVVVSLYRDANNNGIPDGPAIATTTTDASGYYLFDNLAPGLYIVGLNNANFGTSQPLNGLLSSTGNFSTPPVDVGGGVYERDDRRDNGIDTLNAIYGLLSHTVQLTTDQAPQNEAVADSPVVGAGGSNPNSDLTVDFGLYRPMSLGNHVWLDLNDNGLRDGTEAGVPNVTVELYRDVNNDGIPVPAGLVGTTTTDANGFYLFDGLGEANYIVLVTPTNFQAGGALVGLDSSTPTFSTPADNNDNGINNPAPATDNPTIGVRSNVVELRVNSNPLGETFLSGNAPDHGPNFRGRNGETDNNSNLTIDFGFSGATLSLGNRIWFDEGAGLDGRNGVQDASEVGVPNGVIVSLYRDNDNNGVPDGPAIATTVTTTNGSETGYYLFDNLAPGRYIVGLNASNFATGGLLEGYGASPIQPADTDRASDAVANSAPYLGNGLLSRSVELTFSGEPTGETDLGIEGTGANGVDNNSNLTADFGLYRPLSLGNRVWFDTGAGANYDNGIQNAGEPGIAGVTLTLYIDDGDNVLDAGDLLIATTTTDPLGYYIFDNLLPGNYLVAVDASNFTSGVLQGYNASTPNFADNVDRNNNGVPVTAGAFTGAVASNVVTLDYNTMPLDETDLSGNAPAHGPNFRGRNGEANKNSDLTIDFGFVANAMSLGNRVWLDNGSGGGTEDNGIQDGAEPGVRDVRVDLYAADTLGNPIGSPIRTTTTDTDGYYLFDNLPPGRYVVVLPPSNFVGSGRLVGYLSSTGNVGDTDTRDNGIDTPNPAFSGVRSGLINLLPMTAPLGEDEGTLGRGTDSNGNPIPDDNSNLTVDFGLVQRSDWGDNPDSYGTTLSTNGPRHTIIPTLYMGALVDPENDGQPSVGADGDDGIVMPDDEDGVNIPRFVANTIQEVQIEVFNNSGTTAYVVGWVDFNGNGVFDPAEAGWFDANLNGIIDGGENRTVAVPSSPTTQYVSLFFAVPNDADIATGGTTYARFRITTDTSIFAGGTPTGDPSPLGAVNDGEIEDYRVLEVLPPGIAVTKTNGTNIIVVTSQGGETTYTITIENSAAPQFNVTVLDDIVAQNNPGIFDLSSITWTCQTFLLPQHTPGDDVSSCLAGVIVPNANGTGAIAQPIDLPTYTGVRFTLNVRLLPTVTGADSPITNAVVVNSPDNPPIQLGDGTDVDFIVFDPPFGTKTGQVIGDNTVIRWTQVWINTGAPSPATITDPIQPNQTFSGNLVCTEFGLSFTNSCVYDIVTNTVTWTGNIGTGQPNRVEIAFDVLIPGEGVYNNVASIQTGGNNPQVSNAVGVVNIDGEAIPGPGMLDPTIVKLVDPNFAQPNEIVRWEIKVFNPNNGGALPNIGFTDTIDSRMTIIGATSTSGTVTIDGQNVTFFTPALQAQETVDIVILTRVRPDADVPFIIDNVVALDFPYEYLNANAVVLNIRELPATGETPIWRDAVIVGAVAVIASALLGLGALLAFRRRRA